jgi:hypothetical protein
MKLGRRRFLARAPTLIAGMDPTGGPFQNPRSRNLGPPNKGTREDCDWYKSHSAPGRSGVIKNPNPQQLTRSVWSYIKK